MGTAVGQAPSRRPPARWLVAVLLSTALLGCDADPVVAPAPRLDPRPVSAPAVLAPATADPAEVGQGENSLRTRALQRLLSSGPLGTSPGALVVDATTGRVLLDREGAVPRTPASVLKLATGAAALTTLDPGSRLRTRAVTGTEDNEVILVGAGDTTLTRAPNPRAYPRRASLRELADATTAALRARGRTSVTLRVDDSLFAGPAVSPNWPPTYVTSGVVSPVSALCLDGGRVAPRSDARAADPALAAGRSFADLLTRRGVSVTGEVGRSIAPVDAEDLAAVESPTVTELVELMLGSSDNELAESLLRLVAAAGGRPATFSDGTAVVEGVLAELGVPIDGLVLLDGSGLARGSAVAPATLAALLVLAAGVRSPPALDHLVTGLPVAGFSGTLSARYRAGRPRTAAGLVRAKTGTLNGVSTLAGITATRTDPVVFVVMADRVPGDTLAAQAVLDRFAATLAGPST